MLGFVIDGVSAVQVADGERPRPTLQQPADHPAPVGQQMVGPVEQRLEAGQHMPRPEEPAGGQDVEYFEHRRATGVHAAIGAQDVNALLNRVAKGDLGQLRPLGVTRRVSQRHELEPVLEIEVVQDQNRQVAQAAVAVVEDGQPLGAGIEQGSRHAAMLPPARIAYDEPMQPRSPAGAAAVAGERLPLDDPLLADGSLDLVALEEHWAPYAARRPMTAEQMRGADRRAQRMGVPGSALMEQAGAAVAAGARALLRTAERPAGGIVLVLAGPGNNGGDGYVAARHLAAAGIRSAVVLVASERRPGTPDATRNWHRLEGLDAVERVQAASGHEVAVMLNGLQRAALVIDALLGTGVKGTLRDPVRQAVEVCLRARSLGVPVLAIDTPTALDLTSGEPSDPVVRADVTVTFHRPKHGLLTRAGRQLAGRVLVAPIGIPAHADPG